MTYSIRLLMAANKNCHPSCSLAIDAASTMDCDYYGSMGSLSLMNGENCQLAPATKGASTSTATPRLSLSGPFSPPLFTTQPPENFPSLDLPTPSSSLFHRQQQLFKHLLPECCCRGGADESDNRLPTNRIKSTNNLTMAVGKLAAAACRAVISPSSSKSRKLIRKQQLLVTAQSHPSPAASFDELHPNKRHAVAVKALSAFLKNSTPQFNA